MEEEGPGVVIVPSPLPYINRELSGSGLPATSGEISVRDRC